MKIGIGPPNTAPGASGEEFLDWARRAEERGFSTLANIDRITYPNYDSLTALAAVAGATELSSIRRHRSTKLTCLPTSSSDRSARAATASYSVARL
ncbi:MAG: hypothetical protein ABJA81_03170 [Nocardioidaceae bacterium]